MRAWLAVMAIGMATPATAETIRVTAILPAAAPDAALLTSVAVAPFGGRDGGLVADAIAARLARADDEPRPFFDLVARPGAADAVVEGHATVAIGEEDYTESRRRCAEKEKGKCVRHERYTVDCIRRTVALTGAWRLVRRRDSRVLMETPIAQRDSDDACEDNGVLDDVGSTVEAMARGVAGDLRLAIAPHRETWTPRIREGRGGMARPDADAFKDAVRETKRDAVAACGMFAAIEARAPHPSTRYNVALCAEAAGDLDRAHAGYASVVAWLPGDADDAVKAIRRVDAAMAGAREMVAVRQVRLARRF